MPTTVMIVDDEEIIRKLIRVTLKGSGDILFIEANDAAEALKLARQHRGKIDLLLSDVVMPGRMNGTEMAAQLSHAHPQMKVVLMSGYAPEALKTEPHWDFIQKPFAASEIRETVGRVLADNWLVNPLSQRRIARAGLSTVHHGR
jgi:two-component system cell cycle sensor histidine kinase/response regulator CckA